MMAEVKWWGEKVKGCEGLTEAGRLEVGGGSRMVKGRAKSSIREENCVIMVE